MEVTEADEALVDQVTEEALEGFEKTATEKELFLMRELIRADLLYSPEGQERLRRARLDPLLAKSGDVATQAAAAKPSKTKKGKSA